MMDTIHEIDEKFWISRRRLNLRQLIEKRDIELRNGAIDFQEPEDVSNTREEGLLDELNKFMAHNEKEIKPCFLFNSTDEKALVDEPECKLKTYRLQLEHAKKMISDREYKVSYLMKLETTRRELLMRHLALTNRSVVEPAPDSASSLSINRSISAIVVVQIWPQPNKTAKVKLEKEILFRADQCLTDLRDQFKCQRDYAVPMDLSDNPGQAERIFRGELFKSGFFLISNTFYNDMRDQNNTDLSAGPVDWASKEVIIIGPNGENLRVKRGIGPFERVRMEEHKFEDLEFRLGCPYLYLHQGDCEHLFTISDIRYVPSADLSHMKFPFVTATSIERKRDTIKCYMCKDRPPHWYTRNNVRLPVDPYFFCENCFYSFNYDKDKKKVGQFQAYLYTSAFGIPDSVVMAANRQAQI